MALKHDAESDFYEAPDSFWEDIDNIYTKHNASEADLLK